MSAFAELWLRHEELTQRFAKLLHDDAGQVLTAIALRLSSLDLRGENAVEAKELQVLLDDLLDRFRVAQSSLGAAMVAKRGLASGLSQLARLDGKLQIIGDIYPAWPAAPSLATFRIIESVGAHKVSVSAEGVVVSPRFQSTPYLTELARQGRITLRDGAEGITISIQHGD